MSTNTRHAICLVLLPLLLCSACLLGCERKGQPAPTHTCLIVGLGEDDPLWPVLKASARTYVGTSRSLALRMLAPPKTDPSAQANLVRQNLDARVTTVCLQSDGHEQTRQLAKDLTAAGTPVVLIGVDMPETNRFGHVGWDEAQAGRLVADALKIALDDRTTFMLLHAGQKAEPYASRLRGFETGMENYTFLKELARFDCQADDALALSTIAEQGKRYPQLGAWACLADWPAHVAVEELRRALPPNTRLVLVGLMPRTWPLLETGICPAAVGTDYGRWGYEAVSLSELAYRRAISGSESRHTPPRIVRTKDIQQFQRDWAAWLEGKIDAGRAPATRMSVILD